MNIGGTEKALLNMLAEMPIGKYDITLLLLEQYGEFLDYIPPEVHVDFLQGYENIQKLINDSPYTNAINLFRNRKYVKAFNILLLHLMSKITNNKTFFYKYILRKYPMVEEEYDIALAYAGPMDFITYYVLKKIKSKKKIQWIHFDVTKIGFNKKLASRMYEKFDKIFVVSNEGKNRLVNMFPNLKEKVEVFLNIISSNLITKMAEENTGFQDAFSGIRILTVGRLSKEKGQDLTIPVLAKLKHDGFNVRWYCIGEGSCRREYEQYIQKYNLEEEYILLGSKPNPYPFMKQCDIYVQSSRHEGYCITLAEARCFNSPIVSTNFITASEQIINGQTGIIVGCDEHEIYNAIKELISDESLRNKIGRGLANELVDTRMEIGKLFNAIDNIS
jgi:glycosyltransferase involved in cell wall biosynthesis